MGGREGFTSISQSPPVLQTGATENCSSESNCPAITNFSRHGQRLRAIDPLGSMQTYCPETSLHRRSCL